MPYLLRRSDRPVVVVDLFAGIGGATQGFINAGAKVILAVDNWDSAIDVHVHNFPNCPALNLELGGDIDEFVELVKSYLPPGNDYHFHLHGSPPCQKLSQANAQSNPQEGMILVNWFFDVVDALKPDSWSMENVVPVGKYIGDSRSWVKINSADYGTPQTRQRVFAGEGWELTPTHSKDQWVGVIDALPHLKDEYPEDKLYLDGQRSRGSYSGSIDPTTGKRKWRDLKPLMRSLDEPAYTQMRSPRHIMVLNTIGAGDNGSRRAISSDRDVREPAKTINNNTPSLRIVDGDKTPVKLRTLTLEETLIIQGFPPSFSIPDSIKRTDAWVMVGNCVCPPVAEAVIKGLIK